ncbi:MAG: hypothetical protein M1823_003627 [Watsoniomyces obsoletus]|nr:MAG: hypothetical protein M1823_003627 [Watsoniomyces obsoletus]
MRDLSFLLDGAEWRASQFCVECMMRGLRPDLAARQIPFYHYHRYPGFPEFPDHPSPPAVVIEKCSTRIKTWIVQDYVDVLDDYPTAGLRIHFDDYAQHLQCSMSDYDPTFGTDEYRSKFWAENQEWSEKRLNALHPDERAHVKDLLERNKRRVNNDEDHEGPVSFNWKRVEEVGDKIKGLQKTVKSVKPKEGLAGLQRSVWPAVKSSQAWKGIKASMTSPSRLKSLVGIRS